MLRPDERVGRWQVARAGLAAVCALIFGAVAGIGAQSPGTLPAGTGSDVVRAKCLGCHEADLIVQQRLARPGWVRELDKMERWGAVLTADEKSTAADYLARHFAPGSPSAVPDQPTLDAGKASMDGRCLGCHESDLITQQRLDRAAWGRELDKMIRWGATVPAAERDALTTYLFTRFGRSR